MLVYKMLPERLTLSESSLKYCQLNTKLPHKITIKESFWITLNNPKMKIYCKCTEIKIRY